ncbi:hypothetical protein OG429_03720 [Streptomyces sp. NBC_00190]|uniref:hypothetical protein n=1 Tax=unclassified Streptomyces TaxID=2593676 RepID=UPI002E27E847|nr:hypothetical protein [Streptomyces sp. NBC_00190]WSZ38507.1 hypothetical protein OG239_06725 [Streptomyces sp. NBC_00868]
MRTTVGAVGAALLGYGVLLLFDGGQYLDVAVWLAGAVALHDGIVAPLVLAVGLLLAGVRASRTVRGALIVAASLTVVALPVLLRPGTRNNPSVLPLDYPRNWSLALVAVAVLAALLHAARWVRGRRGGRRPEIAE